MTPEEKIAYIKATREEVMTAAREIIERRMEEYNETFGWDITIDSWLWNGMNDCGIGYLIAIGNSTNTANLG